MHFTSVSTFKFLLFFSFSSSPYFHYSLFLVLFPLFLFFLLSSFFYFATLSVATTTTALAARQQGEIDGFTAVYKIRCRLPFYSKWPPLSGHKNKHWLCRKIGHYLYRSCKIGLSSPYPFQILNNDCKFFRVVMVLPARGLIPYEEEVVSPYSISPPECFTSSGLFLVCAWSIGIVIRNLPETAGALWLRYGVSHAAITCNVALRAPYFPSQFPTPLPESYMTS
jgi:hypothetical protein